MSDKITVYQKPTCSTCREADRVMREAGYDYERVNYYLEPLGEGKLRELIRKMGVSPRELLRTKEQLYRDLELGRREVSDDELIRLMAEHPDLIQRPIVERGDRAVLGRPVDKIKAFLEGE